MYVHALRDTCPSYTPAATHTSPPPSLHAASTPACTVRLADPQLEPSLASLPRGLTRTMLGTNEGVVPLNSSAPMSTCPPWSRGSPSMSTAPVPTAASYPAL